MHAEGSGLSLFPRAGCPPWTRAKLQFDMGFGVLKKLRGMRFLVFLEDGLPGRGTH